MGYIFGGSTGGGGGLEAGDLKTGITPTGAIDGVNETFTVPDGVYVSGSLEVMLNGQDLVRGTDFTETTPGSGILTVSPAPITGSALTVSYLIP